MCALPGIELQLPSILASRVNDKEWQEMYCILISTKNLTKHNILISELVQAKCKLNDVTVKWIHSYFKHHTTRGSHQLCSWNIKWSWKCSWNITSLAFFLYSTAFYWLFGWRGGRNPYQIYGRGADALEGRNKIKGSYRIGLKLIK